MLRYIMLSLSLRQGMTQSRHAQAPIRHLHPARLLSPVLGRLTELTVNFDRAMALQDFGSRWLGCFF